MQQRSNWAVALTFLHWNVCFFFRSMWAKSFSKHTLNCKTNTYWSVMCLTQKYLGGYSHVTLDLCRCNWTHPVRFTSLLSLKKNSPSISWSLLPFHPSLFFVVAPSFPCELVELVLLVRRRSCYSFHNKTLTICIIYSVRF